VARSIAVVAADSTCPAEVVVDHSSRPEGDLADTDLAGIGRGRHNKVAEVLDCHSILERLEDLVGIVDRLDRHYMRLGEHAVGHKPAVGSLERRTSAVT